MNKYAEIYGGKVRDIRLSELDYVSFCSIWSPSSYWVDVTGITDIEIGYLVKFTEERGTYFEPAPDHQSTSAQPYPLWKGLTAYPANYRVQYEDYVYETNFEFVSSPDQTPDKNKQLYTLIPEDDVPLEFREGLDIIGGRDYIYGGKVFTANFDMPECRYVPSEEDTYHWVKV